MEELFLLAYFMLALGGFFAVLAERNRKEQAKSGKKNPPEVLVPACREGEGEARAAA